jgi:hypothetical protein
MVRFAKWSARESFVRVSVCGVKGGIEIFYSGCPCDILLEMS